MKTKATGMMRRNDGYSPFRQSTLVIAAVALGAATAVHAADCYWAGGTSSAWETAGNWTTTEKKPTNDGAFFRKDKFADRFKNDKYVVTFSAAEANTWRTYFNNCGSANEPIILRANNATSGLTGGDAKDNSANNQEGIYIGTSYTAGTSGSHDTKASDGDAYVRFEKGTFATGAKYSYWFLGNGSYSGHMTVAGATINSPNAFYLNRGSLTVESGTVSMSGDLKMGTNGDTTLTVNGGKLTVGLWPRFESSSYAKTINLSGGTMEAYIIRNVGGSGCGGVGRIYEAERYRPVNQGVSPHIEGVAALPELSGTTAERVGEGHVFLRQKRHRGVVAHLHHGEAVAIVDAVRQGSYVACGVLDLCGAEHQKVVRHAVVEE